MNYQYWKLKHFWSSTPILPSPLFLILTIFLYYFYLIISVILVLQHYFQIDHNIFCLLKIFLKYFVSIRLTSYSLELLILNISGSKRRKGWQRRPRNWWNPRKRRSTWQRLWKSIYSSAWSPGPPRSSRATRIIHNRSQRRARWINSQWASVQHSSR